MSAIDINKVIFDSDIGDKRKIAELLQFRYNVPIESFPGSSDAFQDLIHCWGMREYYIAAYDALRIYAPPSQEKTDMLDALDAMYTSILEVVGKIVGFYGTAYDLTGLNFTNPHLS